MGQHQQRRFTVGFGPRTRGVLLGMAAVLLLFGAADALTRVLGGTTSPLTAVGLLLIRLLPSDLVKLAIDLFGEADKIVLILSVGAGGLVLGGVLGGLLHRRRRTAVTVFALIGAGLVALVALRPESGPRDLIAAVLGVFLGAVVLALGIPRKPRKSRDAGLEPAEPAPADPTEPPEPGLRRRTVLILAGASALIGTAGLAVGQTVATVGRGAVDAARRFVLPTPVVTAAAVPAAAEVGVDGVAPFTTAQADLYRIDTALVPPAVDSETWELRVDGLVEEPFTLSFAELLEEPLEEHRITLTCVSNPVGGDLLGTGVWTGLPVRTLLARARPHPEADMVLSHSVDGFTASTPLEAMTDDRASLVAIGMNGEPLTAEHGYPVRLIVPGLYGFVSATKWVTRIEVTRFDRAEAYWTRRGWDARAPILVSSRIDVPGGLDVVDAGDIIVAGSAWSQGVGIASVQVRLDDGDWTDAELGAEVNVDTWRQWRLAVPVEAGRHALTVRAIGRDGTVQTAERRDPIPNSATGHHRVEFRAE
ncbi:molybdopterin-dependent oxidoreductase [Citricoccus sp. NR2]|uniref:molybdopterin-dependent oxidoreductase n=1 Tax=Citricoccus sp. NR2 TaxID=3004095 RepID=UPI0022DE9409|nr:molybdopterin-dependent oxidoreductase [Citricoccus sp. NR2]WBL19715.1 molybdopterin-dependent oxidoreductase [Citricoccus sp. NR2]